MGRLLFGGILAVLGVLYIWLALQAVMGPGGFMAENILGLIIFLIIGVAAAIGSFNLLKQKSNR